MPVWFSDIWPSVLSALAVVLPASATAHIVLNKRDVRGAIGWVGLVWLAPGLGVLLYILLGVNRIRREARALRAGRILPRAKADAIVLGEGNLLVGAAPETLRPLAGLMERVTGHPLRSGNSVRMLVDGDEVYPAMLAAIEGARHSITLATYIFDNDPVGRRFADALGDAQDRGVAVRVLVDAAGSRYSIPSIRGPLRRRNVPSARFLPTWLPWRAPFFNLRNHRKILVVDGGLAFAGGMNIRQSHVLGDGPAHPVRDTHFRIEGPVVAQLQAVFAEDWQFTTGESLVGAPWFAESKEAGPVVSRVIPDGPDEDFDKMRWAFLGALACASRSIRIATPYFLPDGDLLSALEVAALRGVSVSIVVPARSNIRVVDWAMWASLPFVLQHGCRVFLSKPPFDHSKLLVVDDSWVLFGSANWDPRSLRLNFELGVECFDPDLAARVAERVDESMRAGRELTPDEMRRRPLPLRLRDGLARLLSPYL